MGLHIAHEHFHKKKHLNPIQIPQKGPFRFVHKSSKSWSSMTSYKYSYSLTTTGFSEKNPHIHRHAAEPKRLLLFWAALLQDV
jgi:hypothetical protein